jgi:hypothetical protein
MEAGFMFNKNGKQDLYALFCFGQGENMFKGFVTVVVCFIFTSLLFSETIYLKNGKVLKGKITKETTFLVTLEMDEGEEWKEIDRDNIKEIVRNEEPAETKPKRKILKGKKIDMKKLNDEKSSDEKTKFVFGIKPTSTFQSSYLGVNIWDQVVLMAGLDYLHLSVKADYSHDDWDTYYDFTGNWWTNPNWWEGVLYKRYVTTAEGSASISMYMPHVGLKLFLNNDTKPLRPYIIGNIFYIIPVVKFDGTIVVTEYDHLGRLVEIDDDNANQTLNDVATTIKAEVSTTGTNIGGGVEYKISEYFSIGGEYIIKTFSLNITDGKFRVSTYNVYRGNISTSFGQSNAALVLNFHF